MKVFDNQGADGNSAIFYPDVPNSITGKGLIYVSGNLGGGTITVEAELPDESAFVDVPGIADITATGAYSFDLGPFVGRLVLTGATTPAVDAWVEFDGESLRNLIEDTRSL